MGFVSLHPAPNQGLGVVSFLSPEHSDRASAEIQKYQITLLFKGGDVGKKRGNFSFKMGLMMLFFRIFLIMKSLMFLSMCISCTKGTDEHNTTSQRGGGSYVLARESKAELSWDVSPSAPEERLVTSVRVPGCSCFPCCAPTSPKCGFFGPFHQILELMAC